MSDENASRATPERLLCRKCMVIRLFLLAVASLAVLQLISPATLHLAASMSTLRLACLFVGFLALAALSKAGLERRTPASDHTDQPKRDP